MQTQLTKNKKLQRKFFLAQRRALTASERQAYSAEIREKIINCAAYKKARMCFLFAAMPDEVQTKELIVDALKAGKRVCLPYITDKKGGIMQAAEISSFEELVAGAYGILSVDETKLRIVNPRDIDFVLVPGVGFDRRGYRLGMGGGFYDRFLAQTVNAYLAAAVYDCQLADEVTKDEHDAKVHAVFTEKCSLDFL